MAIGLGKGVLIIIGGLVVLGAIGSAVSNQGSTASNNQTVGYTQSTTTQAAATATPQGDILMITNSVYSDQGYGTYKVDGEAKNNDSVKHSATLKATFYDASGKILGTA